MANACQLSPLLWLPVWTNPPVSTPHISALAWTLNPGLTSRACSRVSTKTRIQPYKPRHPGSLNSEQRLTASSPRADTRAEPAQRQRFGCGGMVLRFLMNCSCLGGKQSKGESEGDHFDSEAGKNKIAFEEEKSAPA